MSRARHFKSGGRANGGSTPDVVSGNPKVLKEAKARKRGGRVLKMSGGPVMARLDRPGRRRGGGVGANTSPLSTAHSGSGGAGGSSKPGDTYGGLKSD